jgi:hypothetical protein
MDDRGDMAREADLFALIGPWHVIGLAAFARRLCLSPRPSQPFVCGDEFQILSARHAVN